MADVEVGEGVEIIESVRHAAEPALEAVRKFVETVNDMFPDVGEDGPRHKIIDSAFKMTEQLVGVSTQFAEKIINASINPLKARS